MKHTFYLQKKHLSEKSWNAKELSQVKILKAVVVSLIAFFVILAIRANQWFM